MKHFYNKLRRVMLTMVIALPFCAGAQLNVNSAATAQDLANAIVGSGVTVSNVQLSCADNAYGLFSNGNTTNVGISNGVILTTGHANDAIGPNNSEDVSVNNSDAFDSDADLDPLVSGSLNDVCALSFDFVATSDVITVQYVFSSEEYNEYVCSSFNDIFAFFVSGPNPLGGSYSNLNVALIPSTSLPVSINSVNNGNPGSQGSLGACTSLDYSAYYVDNSGGVSIQYDGFTVVLTAQVLITPGESYSFKFAIADISDSSLDSGVFIRGESFSIFNCQAGTISVNGSVEPILICSDDDIADSINIVTNSTATGDTYVFLLTNAIGEILAINETGNFDLSSYSNNSYIVYGLSYDGDVNGIEVGGNVSDISVSDNDGCFDLSSGISVVKDICIPFELISCAPDTTLECGSDLNDFDVTGVPVFAVYGGDGIVEISFTDTYLETSDCYSVISRTWTLTYGDITEICVQIITLIDTQGPVFPELENIYVQCLEEVPGPLSLEAYDVCSEASAVETFTSQTGEPTDTCVLSTAFGPGADWAVWLPVLAADSETSSANFVFDANGGHFDQFIDGTAHLYGTVVNSNNVNESFIVDLWLENKADWATWSGLGRNYKDDMLLGCAAAQHINWEYYELVGGFSTLTGAGDLAGDVLYLYHMPSSYYFGFQKGIGANNKNCNNGLSGWFSYDGFVNGESVEGHGDVNVDAECGPKFDDDCVHNTSFTHFYRSEDACGHATIASHNVIVEDTTAPVFDNCPSDLTIECSDVIPAIAEGITATDNCVGDVEVTFVSEVTVGDACETIIRRTWLAVDDCFNEALCIQTITILDTTAPVLNGLPSQEITVECSEIPAAAEVTATDNCQEVVVVNYYDSIFPGNCPGYYTIVRYWSAADSCGNGVDFTQTINVVDTTSPVFDEYDFYAHIECNEIPAVITATDNCGTATVEVTYEVLNSGGCLGVYHRIYTATDECGNTATAEQYIAIMDTTAPELVGVPAEATLECSEVEVGEDGNYFGNDGVYGVDNCQLEVTVSYSEEVVATDDNCPSSYDIIRTWTGVDYCENDTTVSVVFHIVDTTAPELYIPYDYSAECDEELYYGEAYAYDNCTGVTISVEVDTVFQGCPQSYDIIRTFVATDECGNASEPQTQTITVRDTEAPEFEMYNDYYEFECNTPIVTENPIATDNCGLVSYETTDSEISYDGPCFALFYRTTVATDECGNESEAVQTIIIRDTTAPVITGLPEVEVPCEEFDMNSGIFVEATDNCNEFVINIDSTQLVSGECAGVYIRYYTATDVCYNTSETFIQIIRLLDETAPVGTEPEDIQVLCSDEIPSFDPNFTDNCGGEVEVVYVGYEVTADCFVTYTESWTAYDNCGNSTFIDRNITIYDNVNPWFETFPADATINCDDDVPAVVYPIAYDNCDEQVEITLAIDEVPGTCPNESTIYRTFRGVDNCGNQVVETQVITIVDETAPVFDLDQQWSYEYECDEDADLIQPTASDNCGEVTYSHIDTSYYAVECFEYFTRIWTATDECGNSSDFYQYIYFVDTTAPVITGEPLIEIPCEEFSLETGIFVEATDNCNTYVINIDSTQLVSGECAGVYMRYYTATDFCQNTSETFLQIIRLTDETAPVGTEPSDITVECDEQIPSFDPNFTDNCGGELEYSFSSPQVIGYCNVSYTETWTATDNCGNTASVDRVVTIVDTTDPSFEYVPSNIVAECDEYYYEGYAYAYDNCDWSVDVTESRDTAEGNCPANYVITRTFTATDDCGNTATATQTITVQDTTAPWFGDNNQNEFAYDCTETAEVVEPMAYDACSEVELSYADTSFWNQGTCYYGFTRVWTATDACGNSAPFYQYIYFYDTTAPVITGAIEIEIPCEEFSIETGIFVEATDNCSEYTISIDSTLLVSGECAGVYLRYYTASDVCGNVSDSFEQIIRLTDETAPVGTEPSDITVECDEQIPSFDPNFTDNCGGELEYSFSSPQVIGYCNVSYTETWTATDNCGNTASVDRVVTIVDTTDPSFEYVPSNIVAECDEYYYEGYAYAYDNCDWSVDVTESRDTAEGNCPANYVITRTFTATDDCGNTATATQTITVEDTTAPSFGDDYNNEFAYECFDQIEVNQPLAWDACSSIEYSYDDSILYQNECSAFVIRTWIATDACGNEGYAAQYISVYDNTSPEITTELSDVNVECASEIPAPVAVSATDNCDDNVSVVPSVTVLESDDCGNQVLLVEYYAYDNCQNYDYASYYIYVLDETAPVLEGCPSDIVLACDAEIPAAAVVTATDNCGGEIEVTPEEFIMGEMPAEGSIADCDLLTPALPEGNPCNYPAAWAMALFNMPTGHKYYSVSEGELVRYPDGTIQLTATMNNVQNPANGFQVNVTFANEMDWATWSTQGFPTSFKADCGGEDENHPDWLYFILQAGAGAELTGFGAYTGSVINLAHAPSNNYFGFQLGNGANNYNGADNGFGGWFTYSGSWINGQSTTSVTGAGDFAFELDCCPDYYIVRQWTATDCSGNSATCTQTITFEGTVIEDILVEAPVQAMEVSKADLSIAVSPNPADNNTVFTFKSLSAGRAQLEVFDMAGAKVADVYNNNMEAGLTYNVNFDVNTLATGIYMFRITQNGQTEMGRLVINK